MKYLIKNVALVTQHPDFKAFGGWLSGYINNFGGTAGKAFNRLINGKVYSGLIVPY